MNRDKVTVGQKTVISIPIIENRVFFFEKIIFFLLIFEFEISDPQGSRL